MPRINLLPWRDERRKQAQQMFFISLAVAAAVAVGVVFGASRVMDSRINGQNQRNELLRSEIRQLDSQVRQIERLEETRARLVARKDVIERLQANRMLMVHLFDQMVRTVPSGMRLVNVRQTGDDLVITGTTQSEARVSTYLRNIESSPFLHNPTLRIVEADAADTDAELPYRFAINMRLALPGSEDEDQGFGGQP